MQPNFHHHWGVEYHDGKLNKHKKPDGTCDYDAKKRHSYSLAPVGTAKTNWVTQWAA